MLLFVRNPYYAAICRGEKRYELRAGGRYRNVKPGDTLSINGRFRVLVEAVEVCRSLQAAIDASELAKWPVTAEAIRACYPDAEEFRLFHFSRIP